MVDVENPEATAWGEALTLRVLIWMVPTLSSTAMTYNWSKDMSFLVGKKDEGNAPWSWPIQRICKS